MCGCVGFVGKRWDASFLGEGLRRLEYRGYDSWGVLTLNGPSFIHAKQTGAISNSYLNIDKENFPGSIGIGHTRWATNGEPTTTNAHPIIGGKNRDVAVVHNGVISNYRELKPIFEKFGYKFTTDTDTEIIAHLFGDVFEGFPWMDPYAALRQVTKNLKGQYAFIILSKRFPDKLLAACNGSPLLVSPEGLVASESVAFSGFSEHVSRLEDGQMLVLSESEFRVFTQRYNNQSEFPPLVDVTVPDSPKESLGDYPHYMLKEIEEQPEVLLRLWERENCYSLAKNADRIHLFGCGSSYHAALLGRHYFESIAEIPTQVDYASQMAARILLADQKTLYLALTQSGETKDTVAVMQRLYEPQMLPMVACITNNLAGYASRFCDAQYDIDAGPERSVAATKSFTAQALTLLKIADNTDPVRYPERETWGEELANSFRLILAQKEFLHDLAEEFLPYDNLLFLGTGLNYPVALEAALKFKEVAYIHAEAMPAAEMKHGPIALITPESLSVFLVTHYDNVESVAANAEEIKARGGKVFVLCDPHAKSFFSEVADEIFLVPEVAEPLSPLVLTLPMQLLSYYTAVRKGINPDRPRSLAKTITV